MIKIEYPENINILYLEADINYTIFHLSDGKKKIVSYTLKRIAEIPVMATFKRINRKFLVNPNVIREIRIAADAKFVVLSNGKELKMSRRKIKTLNY